MDARDQEPLAVASGKQFHRIGNARRAAGEHHDAIGLAVRRDLGAAQLREESDEADRRADEHNRQHGHNGRAQPAARRGDRRFRQFIVRLHSHLVLMILPHCKLRTFSDEVESVYIVQRGKQRSP